jgi:hypothetical protein
MLCSLAELGWDTRVADRVAVLRDSLHPGTPLDDRAGDWRRVVHRRTNIHCLVVASRQAATYRASSGRALSQLVSAPLLLSMQFLAIIDRRSTHSGRQAH